MNVIKYIINQYLELSDDGFSQWNQAYKEFLDWFGLQKIYLDENSNFLKEQLLRSRSELDSLISSSTYSYHGNKKSMKSFNLERIKKLEEIRCRLNKAILVNRLSK